MSPSLAVPHRADFDVTGCGDDPSWADIDWAPLNRRPGGAHDYTARFKMCWSDTGIYVLFEGTDRVLTATLQDDFLDLWEEDVYEVFFWPDEAHPVYFEYEISPLGYELPILVPNLDGRFLGWRPWHYEGERRVRKQVAVRGGERASMASVAGWSAEVFIPFALLQPLANVPPRPGTTWRANVYRMDYDGGRHTQWDWARVGESFHEFERFGTIEFA